MLNYVTKPHSLSHSLPVWSPTDPSRARMGRSGHHARRRPAHRTRYRERRDLGDRYRDSDRNNGITSKRGVGTSSMFELADPNLDTACFGHPPLVVASNGPPQACVVDKVEQFAAELSITEPIRGTGRRAQIRSCICRRSLSTASCGRRSDWREAAVSRLSSPRSCR